MDSSINSALLPESHCRYLGVICVLVRTRRSISPYYTLNITDRRIPLTTVVETTHRLGHQEYAGGHLIYAAKYVNGDHPDLTRAESDVAADYLDYVRTIFNLELEDVLSVVVQRAPAVEPVHLVGGAQRLPDMFPLPGLALVSTAHVYPDTVNGQAVLGVSENLVSGLLERLPAARLEAA